MSEIRLTPRLRTLGEWVPAGARAADVGTDHGYLPIWLRQTGRSPFVIASDLNAAPLASARRNAERADVTGIDFRLSDGLAALAPEEVEAVVIAGMSGETMVNILDAAAWDWTDKTLLLQPMTKRPELLTWLYAHGLHVAEEKLVSERRKSFWVFRISAGEMPLPRPALLWAGFRETAYAHALRTQLISALGGLRRASVPDEGEIRRVEELLEDMKDAYGW